MCHDLWILSLVFLLNKYSASGGEADSIASSDTTKAPIVSLIGTDLLKELGEFASV